MTDTPTFEPVSDKQIYELLEPLLTMPATKHVAHVRNWFSTHFPTRGEQMGSKASGWPHYGLNDTEGAILASECPGKKNCTCGRCAVCGYPKHKAIHGPIYPGDSSGKPWGHKFVPPKDSD